MNQNKKIELSEVIREMKKELEMRNKVYPTLIEKLRMTREESDFKIECIKQAIKILENMIPKQGELF